MTLGASNVSFGLPDRHALNAAFLPMAAAAGPDERDHGRALAPECVTAARAADLLLGHDEWGATWISDYRRAGAAGDAT